MKQLVSNLNVYKKSLDGSERIVYGEVVVELPY